MIAIRQAVALVHDDEGALEEKELWISLVFPDGRLPGRSPSDDEGEEDIGMERMMDEIAQAMFEDSSTSRTGRLANVTGIGINCTKPRYILPLVRSLGSALGRFQRFQRSSAFRPSSPPPSTKPTTTSHPFSTAATRSLLCKQKKKLMICPDGGREWSTATSDWVQGSEMAVDDWARVVSTATMEAEGDVWGEIALGGCCNTGPEHIRALTREAGVR